MKLVFSESQPDYGHYIFPYAVWAFPEEGETPSQFFELGFLPSSRELDRFYLCRQVRINLRQYQASSENRRILRKGEGISPRIIPRPEFDFSPRRREFCKAYAELKFGKDVMTRERLDSLFKSRITSHVLLFEETASGEEVGAATLYLENTSMAYYYYAFYDLKLQARNLGMFMMTSAVALLAELGFGFLYLGSCYSTNALYKTQFSGAEFFNGVKWSSDLAELKYLIQREQRDQHLLESEEYRMSFYGGEMARVISSSQFQMSRPAPGSTK